MPKSKTFEFVNNIHKGVRKLSKKNSLKSTKINKKNNIKSTKINKKNSIKSTKVNKKNNNTTTEEMLNILNSDDNTHTQNTYTGNTKINLQQNIDKEKYDPLFINEFVQTDDNGNIINTNKIGALLGGISQSNTISQYIPQQNFNNTTPFMNNDEYMNIEKHSKLTISPSYKSEVNDNMISNPSMVSYNNPSMTSYNNPSISTFNNPSMTSYNNPSIASINDPSIASINNPNMIIPEQNIMKYNNSNINPNTTTYNSITSKSNNQNEISSVNPNIQSSEINNEHINQFLKSLSSLNTIKKIA